MYFNKIFQPIITLFVNNKELVQTKNAEHKSGILLFNLVSLFVKEMVF